MPLKYPSLENWAMARTLNLLKNGVEEYTINWLQWLTIKRWKSTEIPAETTA